MNEPIGPHLIRSAEGLLGPVVSAAERSVIETAPGVELDGLAGSSVSLAVVTLEPGAVAPVHRHAHEQVGMLIRGQMTLTVAGETYEIGPGEGYVVPSDVPHGAAAGPEGAVAVEAFVAPVGYHASALPEPPDDAT
ncbi:MAG: cupin domain-containing protein [Nocardioides sp.]|uniref:cupin domain-containing protein n=1 Tax=Nocardioides sp. TaxID=35761 RepID=UPI0039E5A37A